MLGGGTSFEAYGFDKLPSFDVEAKCWTVVQTIPDRYVVCRYTFTVACVLGGKKFPDSKNVLSGMISS